MALIQCPGCGKRISDKAAKCPHCGFTGDNQQAPHPPIYTENNDSFIPSESNNKSMYIWIALIAIIILGAGAWFAFSYTQKADTEQSAHLAQLRTEQRKQDSILAAQKEAARLDSLRQDSIKWCNFTSPDLAFFNLHGHVSTVNGAYLGPLTYPIFDGSSPYKFDYNGKCNQKMPAYSNFKGFTYDKKGRITGGRFTDDIEWFKVKWKGDRISGCEDMYGSHWTGVTYYYDSNGDISKEIREEEANGGVVIKETRIYTILERDKYGNWTKRKASITRKESHDDYENYGDPITNSSKSSETETREITYYPLSM